MIKIGFVAFGEVNTPYERLVLKHDESLALLEKNEDYEIYDGGIVIDDPGYETASEALLKLKGKDMDCLILCVAGWVPTHAVIYVSDHFRHIPVLLWSLCGWYEGDTIITTAEQAGSTALRPALEELDYKFKFVYNIINRPVPMDKIESFISAAHAVKSLRGSRVGTMGYRDMLLYGTQFEGNSLKREIGVEVEPFETLEIVQKVEELAEEEIAKGVQFVKENWIFRGEADEETIKTGVKYALAIGEKIKERNYEAISLIDVDGMKKLLNFPPAMIFMLLDQCYDVLTIPENDILGLVTQLIMKYMTGQQVPYLEYYEFFEKSMLIGVPDYIPKSATKGDILMMPTAFGLLEGSLLNVSKVKDGFITCSRLFYSKGKYKMHVYTAEAKQPMPWNEYGWEDPVPQLPSLEVFPQDCTVEEFANKVSGQHVIVSYGDFREQIKDFCYLLDIEII